MELSAFFDVDLLSLDSNSFYLVFALTKAASFQSQLATSLFDK
jgi:hypothetical protein